MDDDLNRRYRRWHEAEAGGRDEDADTACLAVFAAMEREPAMSADFPARTLAAIAAATAGDRRRARRTRRAMMGGGIAAATAAVYTGGGLAISAASAALVGAIDLLVNLTVRVAGGMQAGTDVWSVLAGLGRALAAFVADPAVTVAILAMQGIAMAALIALHRLLGSDRESLK